MAFVLFFGAVTTAVLADDLLGEFFEGSSTDFIKSRVYIGAFGISSTIDQWGDFNGTIIASHNSGTETELDLIPAIDRKFGWGALIGYRRGPWAVEMSYWRSDHTATFNNGVTLTTPASLQSLNFDFKRYFFTQAPTQPFFQFGFSLPWLWVRQASSLVPSNLVDDETISGIGFNLGAGLEIYLDNNFSIMGGVIQRWTGFNQINGAAKIPENTLYDDGNPSDIGSLEGDGLNFYAGMTFGVE